jgi:polysaccharide deacetylase 2 family uncharacterized protein YibQ
MLRLPTSLATVLLLISAAPVLASTETKYPLLDESPQPLADNLPIGLPVSSVDKLSLADQELNSPQPLPSGLTAPEPVTSAPLVPADNFIQTKLPVIAIIIDDLGNQRLLGERTVALSGPVACAIMPHTSYSTYLANQAYAAGKEVILHLPMQPIEMQRIAGPGEISLDTRRLQLRRILQTDLESVPHAVGINNHMGSLITRHPGHMQWLMEEIGRRGNLFFVDSYTTPSSVAFETAVKKGIPAARRHVFLDGEATEQHVAAQFKRLKQKARNQGYAIGIGHPYPVTLGYLEQALSNLDQQGVRLVTVAQIINQYPAVYPDDFREPAVSDGAEANAQRW